MKLLITLMVYLFCSSKSLAGCPAGWSLVEGECYYFSNNRLSWSEAQSYCHSNGGEILEVSNHQMNVISAIAPSSGQWWIGQNDDTHSDRWRSIKDLPSIAKPLVQRMKNPPQPQCTVFSSYKKVISQENCESQRNFICKRGYAADESEACDTDRGFVQQGSACFAYIETEMTWNEANEYCMEQTNSYLTSITSEQEQGYVNGIGAKYNTDMWIGLSDQGSPGTFRWINGHDQFSYNAWDTNQPSVTNPGSTCIKTEQDVNGKWQTARCSEEKPFICKKGLKKTCPDGWLYANQKCYKFFLNENVYLTWTAARDYCAAINAQLLKIETLEEQLYVASYFPQWSDADVLQLWMGLSDLIIDDVFRWSDNTPLSSYTEWDVDPNAIKRHGIDDCVWMYTGKERGNWEIGNCFMLQSYACQIPEGVNLSPIPIPLVNYTCPDGWRLHKKYCYFFSYEEFTWDEAEAYCRLPENGYSHLVSIHDESENSFLSGHIKGQSWSGLKNQTNKAWAWTDGTITGDFANWKVNQPDYNGNCVRIVGIDDDQAWGQWNDHPCTNTDFAICKAPAAPTQPHPPPTIGTDPNDAVCGEGYFHSTGLHKCYKVVADYKRTWADARLHCQQEGGDLVGINSPEEQAFVHYHAVLVSDPYLWTGGLDAYIGPDFIPDIIQDTFDNGWTWIDGSPFNFVNWAAGEPNNVDDEACLEYYTSDGAWNDVQCENLRGYICEKEDPQHPPDPPADCTSADCCFKHLGVEVGGSITDGQLSASSQLDSASGATRGRLNTLDEYVDIAGLGGPGRGAWIAAESDSAPWFKVDFQDWREVRAIITQGRNGLSQPYNQNNWVTKYSVQYMINPATGVFEDYKEADGTVTIYDANYNQDNQITNVFTRPIVTTAIKILPTDCRKKCAMRVEIVGCFPTCASSLGVSTNPINQGLPILPNQQLTASSEQIGFEAANARLDYVGGVSEGTAHFTLDDATMTYDTARQFCIDQGSDMCRYSEICPGGPNSEPIITGTLSGDIWAPIRDAYNDWVEIGDGGGGGGRECWQHNTNYAPPSWGITTGQCPPWNLQQTCDLKGNLFCCPGNSKSWKPTQSSANEWFQVDFGEYRKISGVFVQGNKELDEWITSYYLAFSDDGVTFRRYKTPVGLDELFPGNNDRNTPAEGFLREPISARYIRVQPQTWMNNIALRMDVVGCEVSARSDCTDKASAYSKDSFTLDCPAGCDDISGNLWGTGIYSDDSYVCLAAIHDGRIIADNGGTVTVKKIDGRDSYEGSILHGVTSQSRGPTTGAVMFQGDHLGCPTGWEGWKDSCYFLKTRSSSVDHGGARQQCQSYGADLVSILSQGEQDFVSSLVARNLGSIETVWIGMTDLDHINYFQWVDGSEVTFTRWTFSEPNGGDKERCVEMYKLSGLWNDVSCDAIKSFVCKMDKIPVNQDQSAVDGCPDGWVGWEGSCYLFDRTTNVWINSEDFCSDLGGHLVTIGSSFEQNFVSAQVAQVSHPDDKEDFYIGLAAYAQTDGSLVYRWSSGEPVTYTAWDRDQPDIRHSCSFPFLYEGVEYYDCISFGRPYEIFGAPWCSADPIFTNHPVNCEGREDGQFGCIVMNKDTGSWSQAKPIGCGSLDYRICEKPREGYTTFPSLTTTPHPIGNCATGWFGDPKSSFCYQINEKQTAADRLTWDQAKLNCESQGANLVSIHSSNEEQIISSFIIGHDEYEFWIGLKRQPDGTYGWSDKTPISYTNWASSEPNNHNGRENCAEARFYTDDYTWNDLNCDAARNWICKIQRGKEIRPPATVPTGTISPAICGSDVDWVAYTSNSGTQKCYHFGTTPLKNWHTSNTYCKSLGGTLVSVTSVDEQVFITGRTSKSGIAKLWIGLVQDTMNGPYIWVDGSPLIFTNWMGGGQPDNNFGQELCANIAANTGLWADANCGVAEGFICQKYPGAKPTTPHPTPVVRGGCPVDWLGYGSKCFLEVGFTDTSLRDTWENAETYCQERNGNLASITNYYYNAFVTSQLFAASSNIWLGLNSHGTDLTFKWTDNEDTSYVNWAPGEPNNYDGREQCTEMMFRANDAGKWNDIFCDEVRPFYCSRKKNIDFPEDYPSESDICPAGKGLVQWDTSCYKIFTEPQEYMTWENARAKCQSEGASLGLTMDLASVWNVYENNFITTLFWPQDGSSTYQDMWIGLYYDYNISTGQNTFKWSDHSPVVYTKWGTNQPQLPPNNKGCAVTSRFGTWGMTDSNTYPVSCTQTTLPFVCKHETLVIPTVDPGTGTCEAGWAALGDYCFRVTPGHNEVDLRSWADADWECQKRKGYLASVHNDLENKAFLSWTDHKNVWIGMSRNGWGGWYWVDNTPVDFTSWDDGEPNDSGEAGEPCVEYRSNGRWNDQSCSDNLGYICRKHKQYSTCAIPTDQHNDCGYPGISEYDCTSRGCCWDLDGAGPHSCYYSDEDSSCSEKGGSCKDFRGYECELGYESLLCSGENERKCCFECDPQDEICNDNVAGWEAGDAACEAGGYGHCQYDSNYCPSNVYESGLCGGPNERRCCVSNPNTNPPDPSPKTTTKPGNPTTTQPGITTTTKPLTTTVQQTAGPTIEDINLNPGLDGGAIAGIIIAVLFIVGGLGAAFYFYNRGNMSIPFLKSKEPSAVGGFSNPIAFNKDEAQMQEVKELAEFDA